MDLTIDVQPVPKPRMTQRDKWKQRPSVMKYRRYCDRLRAAGVAAAGPRFPVSCRLQFVIEMPSSWSKKKRAAMLGTAHQQTPDIDNLIKGVLDALLEDDCDVWRVMAEKRWGKAGSVTIQELG